jgi:transcriptional regulator with XRE-family HTH domain
VEKFEPKTLKEFIHQQIEKEGINIVQLAKRAGVSKSLIYMVFNGQRTPRADFFELLGKALNVPPTELFDIYLQDKPDKSRQT